MKVFELREMLHQLMDQNAEIDISSDPEGNSFGDISESFAEGELLSGKKVYTMYPENNQQGEERYKK